MANINDEMRIENGKLHYQIIINRTIHVKDGITIKQAHDEIRDDIQYLSESNDGSELIAGADYQIL